MNNELCSTHFSNKGDIIKDVLTLLIQDDKESCSTLVRAYYPFVLPESTYSKSRKYTLAETAKIFLRDGFIDRYTGDKLIFPELFRTLSVELPEDFRVHSN